MTESQSQDSTISFSTDGENPNYGILSKQCQIGYIGPVSSKRYFSLSADVFVRNNGSWPVDEYPYLSNVASYTDGFGYRPVYKGVDGGTWQAMNYGSGTDRFSGNIYLKDQTGNYVKFKRVEITDSQGDFLENVSSVSSTYYPNNGAYYINGDGKWYRYIGSDNIDPKSIAYHPDDLEQGAVVTVSVEPSSSMIYGGIVKYKWQVRRNYGEWVELSETTGPSTSYMIPLGTENIQFRVYASDDMGFTSQDALAGPNVAVSQLKAYVGVNGKARKADKMYIGVNGKARQVVKGYIGVNGIARKFL